MCANKTTLHPCHNMLKEINYGSKFGFQHAISMFSWMVLLKKLHHPSILFCYGVVCSRSKCVLIKIHVLQNMVPIFEFNIVSPCGELSITLYYLYFQFYLEMLLWQSNNFMKGENISKNPLKIGI